MCPNPDESYEFGVFRLDAGERRLLREGTPVQLPSKAFDLLAVLVRHHGHLLTKDELLTLVWPNLFVEEANLPANVSLIRRALGEDGEGRRYIETVPKHGYRFVADVRRATEDRAATPEPTPPLPTEPAAPSPSRVVRTAAAVTLGLTAVGAAGWLAVAHLMSGPPPLRVVPLTSYRGAERYPSFSPEGTHVAFTWDGEREDNFDIYTRPVGHEAAFRLTTDPAMDLGPSWSPDGRWIAFLRLRPDGSAGLLLTTPLSRAERLLTVVAAPWIRVGFFGAFLTWSPDSKWVVVADRASAESPFGLVSVSVATGVKRRITSPPPRGGDDIAPAFSPDGRSLAFIRILSFAVSELHLLHVGDDLEPKGEPVRLSYANRRTTSPVWSRDGREIVVASGDVFSGHLYRMSPARPGHAQEIESAGEVGPVLAISHATGRLAYVREVFDPNIWRVPLGPDGKAVGRAESLISSTRVDFNQQFSPDGRHIAFVSNRSGPLEIWMADSDGGNLRRLTSFGGPFTDCPRWSPDGERIVFHSQVDGQLDVSLLTTSGGLAERVTSLPSVENVPSWSRDGRWIYFHSNRTGHSQVWKARTDGSGAVQVTRQGGFATSEAPTGGYLYYSKATSRGPALWAARPEGDEIEVLPGLSDWSTFAPVDRGIYFIPSRGPTAPASIQFLSTADRQITTVLAVDKPVFLGLTVSPDGKSLLYTQIDQEGSDLMLIDGFAEH